MNLAHALAGYWLENESRMSPATIAGYRWAFRRFTDYIGGQRDVASITSDDIRRFLTYLRDEDLAGKSRYNVWVALSSFWSWAEREPALRLKHVIRGVIQQPKYTQKKIVPYNQAELMAMIEACEHSAGWTSRNGRLIHSLRDTALRDRAIIILLVDTGLRASELCGLKIRDYSQDSGSVDVVGKGDKERIVYAGANARKALWRYLATRPSAAAGPHTGWPHCAVGMQSAVDSAIGLPSRSTSASRMLGFVTPPDVSRNFIIPLLDDFKGAESLLQPSARKPYETSGVDTLDHRTNELYCQTVGMCAVRQGQATAGGSDWKERRPGVMDFRPNWLPSRLIPHHPPERKTGLRSSKCCAKGRSWKQRRCLNGCVNRNQGGTEPASCASFSDGSSAGEY